MLASVRTLATLVFALTIAAFDAYAQDSGRSPRTPCSGPADPVRCDTLNLQRKLLAAVKSDGADEVPQLLKALPDVNFLDETGWWSPLSLAIKRGRPDLVSALLEKGADPLARARHGVLLLDIAISTSTSEAKRFRPEVIACVRLALEKAANSGKLKQGSPLDASMAFHNGLDGRYASADLLGLLLRYGADPAKKGNYGRPFDMAIWFSDPELVRLVVAPMVVTHEAEVDAKAYDAFVGQKMELLKAFESAGADPARHVKRNPRVLLSESMRPDQPVAVLEFILKSGVDPNTSRFENSSQFPIFAALADSQKLRVLLTYGANPNAKDPSGYTPLAYALFDQVTDPKKKRTSIQMLLDAGAAVNTNNGGRGMWGALGLTRREEPETVALLMARGATLTDRERGPLLLAVGMDRDDLALAILRRDIKIDPKDRRALVESARRGYSDLALALIQAGADANVADDDGVSPLTAAERRRDRRVADALIAAGAKPSPVVARPKASIRDNFPVAAAAEIDEVVLLDPPRFELIGANRPSVFAFYGRNLNEFEQVNCERSGTFQFIANAGIAGGIAVGACEAESKRVRDLAFSAEQSLNTVLAAVTQGTTRSPDYKERLQKAGWTYEKQTGPDQSEVRSFPVIAIGHGVLGVSTVVLYSEKRRQAIVVQADVTQLCGEGRSVQTPLCNNTKDALIDIAQRMYVRLADKP